MVDCSAAMAVAPLTTSGLMAAYQSRPPYQRNDYLSWINRAKLEQTKQKRMNQMLAEFATGDRYMNMVWRPGAAGSGHSTD